MKKLLLTVLFLIACGGGSASSGETKKDFVAYIRLVVINCPDCITVDQAVQAFDRSKHFYETQLGRSIVLSGVDNVTDPFPSKFLTIPEFYKTEGRFYEVFQHLKKIGIKADTKRGEFILIYDKYLLDNNVKYTAGMAHLCGLYDGNKFAVVYGNTVNTESMGYRMAGVSAHEMGHWHGASHVDFANTITFMSTDIKNLNILNTPPAERSLQEINQCISRSRFVKTKQCKARNKPKLCMKNHNLRTNSVIKEVFGKVE